MIAGLPGTGIGGMYYLLASGWMLLREGWLKLNKRQDLSRSKIVGRQMLLALLIVGGMWVTGELVGRLLLLLSQKSALLHRFFDPHTHNLWTTSIFYWTVATLVCLYLMMQSLRLALRMFGHASTQRTAIGPPARAAVQRRIMLEPRPALARTRTMVSSEQTEEQSIL